MSCSPRNILDTYKAFLHQILTWLTALLPFYKKLQNFEPPAFRIAFKIKLFSPTRDFNARIEFSHILFYFKNYAPYISPNDTKITIHYSWIQWTKTLNTIFSAKPFSINLSLFLNHYFNTYLHFQPPRHKSSHLFWHPHPLDHITTSDHNNSSVTYRAHPQDAPGTDDNVNLTNFRLCCVSGFYALHQSMVNKC